jgi:hypothetical protein
MRTAFLLVLSGVIGAALVHAALQFAWHQGAKFGDAQGYARGFAEGKRVEPDLSVCYGYWFGGTAGRDRMRELKNVCKGLK